MYIMNINAYLRCNWLVKTWCLQLAGSVGRCDLLSLPLSYSLPSLLFERPIQIHSLEGTPFDLLWNNLFIYLVANMYAMAAILEHRTVCPFPCTLHWLYLTISLIIPFFFSCQVALLMFSTDCNTWTLILSLFISINALSVSSIPSPNCMISSVKWRFNSY